MEVAWIVGFVVVGLLFAILPKLRHRPPLQSSRAPIRKRTEEHEAKLNALLEWTAEPRIISAILQARLATPSGLKALVSASGQLTYEELTTAIENLLSDRNVRRVIAQHLERTYDLRRDHVMKALLEWGGKRTA